MIEKPNKNEMIRIQEKCLPKERYEQAIKNTACMDDDYSLAGRQESMRNGFDICNKKWQAYHNQELAKKDAEIARLNDALECSEDVEILKSENAHLKDERLSILREIAEELKGILISSPSTGKTDGYVKLGEVLEIFEKYKGEK